MVALREISSIIILIITCSALTIFADPAYAAPINDNGIENTTVTTIPGWQNDSAGTSPTNYNGTASSEYIDQAMTDGDY